MTLDWKSLYLFAACRKPRMLGFGRKALCTGSRGRAASAVRSVSRRRVKIIWWWHSIAYMRYGACVVSEL